MTVAMIRPLQRPVPLRQSVYDALIDLIVGGELPPGQHMVETDLARQLGVSRQPIREALHRMEAEGWVDLRPSQGAFVHVPTDSEVDELLDVRALLEAETARLSQSSGAAVTAAPGSLGTWVNGETSSIGWDSCRTWPNRAMSTMTPTTVQAPATDARGHSPNSTTATPATASDAGSWAMPAPSRRPTSGPAEPVRRP